MILFFFPLYFLAAAANNDVGTIDANIVRVHVALTNVPTPLPEVRAVLTPIAQVQGQIAQIKAVIPPPDSTQADWPTIMQAIGLYDPGEITLVSLSEADQRIALSGLANNETAVVAYVDALQRTNLFSLVSVQSLQLLNTQQLTMTLTAGTDFTPVATGTVTPTPDLRDQYEPDDAQPKSIYLGQAQQHNFFPAGDVDSVTFTAKAFGYYRIRSQNLAGGVSTFLTVRVGRATFVNNQGIPGSVGSEVDFQNLGPETQAVITITNRGAFGADKTYSLLVEETAPPATKTPSSTPTYTPTSTPAPAVTRTPVIFYVTSTPSASSFNQFEVSVPMTEDLDAGADMIARETRNQNSFSLAAFRPLDTGRAPVIGAMGLRFVLVLELRTTP
jgi:hypothetical protein